MSRTLVLAAALAIVPATAHAFGFGTEMVGRTLLEENEFDEAGFGAGYRVYGQATMTKLVNGVNTIKAGGSMNVWGKMFGEKQDIIRMQANAYTQKDAYGTVTQRGATVEAFALLEIFFAAAAVPFEVYSANYSYGPIAYADKTYSKTFFQASAGFDVGPITLGVTAKAVGSLGFVASGSAYNDSVAASYGPRASVRAVLSVGADAYIASAGIEGSLTLVTVSTPIDASVSRFINLKAGGCSQVSASLVPSITVKGLSGYLRVFADVIGIDPWKHTIHNWGTKYSQTWSLPTAGTSTGCI